MIVLLVVGQEYHFAHTQVEQDLRAHSIIAKFRLRVRHALKLRLDAAGQAGRLRLADQHHDAPAFLADLAHRRLKVAATAAGAVMQHVVQNVERVHADQHRLRRRDVALHQGDMLGILDLVDVDHHAELAAVLAVQHGFQRALDDRLGPAAVGDQVGDGADLQPVELGELHQIRQPGHGAVVVHDLADHAGRVHPRHARQIDRRFGVSRPDQNAAVSRDQREDVAGGRDVVGAHAPGRSRPGWCGRGRRRRCRW